MSFTCSQKHFYETALENELKYVADTNNSLDLLDEFFHSHIDHIVMFFIVFVNIFDIYRVVVITIGF